MSYNLVNPTTGALTRVSGNITSNIIPANASSSNKLVAKSDIIIKHNYSMAGTASLEDDIKTFVTALIALGANTYAGFFNRGGNLGTAGNYSITVYAEAGTSTFASGYIALGAGAMGKTQYEVSYYKPAGSSEEWNIKKIVTENDTVKRKDVAITATASIEDDIKTLLDTLIAETSGVYAGYFTRTGNTSGHYSVSIVGTWNVVGIVSICGATSAAYRVAKFKNTEQGAYTYMVEQLVTNTVLSGTYTIPAQTLANGAYAEFEIPLVPNDFYCGRLDFGNLPLANLSLSYNDFSGTFQDTRSTENRSQYVLYPIGKANLGTLHVYLTNYTGSPVAISDVLVTYYLEHHVS